MPHAKLLTMKYLCEQFPPHSNWKHLVLSELRNLTPECGPINGHPSRSHSLLPLLPTLYSIYRLFSAPYWNCFSHLSASFELILEINVQSWQLSSRRINLNWIDNLLRLFKLVGSVSDCVSVLGCTCWQPFSKVSLSLSWIYLYTQPHFCLPIGFGSCETLRLRLPLSSS